MGTFNTGTHQIITVTIGIVTVLEGTIYDRNLELARSKLAHIFE